MHLVGIFIYSHLTPHTTTMSRQGHLVGGLDAFLVLADFIAYIVAPGVVTQLSIYMTVMADDFGVFYEGYSKFRPFKIETVATPL